MFGRRKVIQVKGFCPICEREATFSSRQEWLRDFFFCHRCGSIPRERALMAVIKTFYPDYRELAIHESSPGNRGASVKLAQTCPRYSASFYYPDVSPGETHPRHGHRCENIENLTFPPASFDLFVTQDVMEHVFHPARAFREIARVLRPGGAHIFTVPLVNKSRPSRRRAALGAENRIIHHQPPEYHGNPIDKQGSLVTMDWGYDLAGFIMRAAATPTTIVMIDNLSLGIRAEYIEVLVSRKEADPGAGLLEAES